MMNDSIGIRSLAVSFGRIIRTNEYWVKKFSEVIQQEKPRRVRLSPSSESTSNSNVLDIWSQAVAPYLADPFRGNVERRIVDTDESSLTLEYRAAKDALNAAQLSPQEVDLMIVASLFPEQVGHGNAVYLAQELGLHCPAWNLESTCSSALVALQNAHALIQTGAYRNALVVVSHIGSQTVDEADSLSWSMGDAAGAFVVDRLKPNQGILASKIVSTAATSGAYVHELLTNSQGQPQIRTRTGENVSTLAETSVDFVRTCCKGAVAAAGVTLADIDFFAFNTPTAWYADVCTQALGISAEKTINLYPRYANIGPVLAIANLYHAAHECKINKNNLVLVYTKGASATAAATIMRWGDVALGSVPAPPLSLTPEPEKIYLTERQKSSISREKLLAASVQEQQQMLQTYLLEWLSHSLQLSVLQINQEQPLALLLDSLMGFLFKTQIENDLQVRVPIEKFFGENNLNHLIEWLLNQLALVKVLASTSVVNAEIEEREKLSL
ncbi:3-oxoacyl-[acyl-carrier-protein] synthase III C-terminal domain-containing protein [Nostoc sp. LEGE 12450]|uniref:3-oxoacyl-[acyl-carrier-protein] synthase III C-terminal domain-containing protein n=1 Tax=Nostoc sp. LEGE 12450 TaxID=1828643 RepID=UPI00187F79E0|nr:3-oxoacyl-[acyl-carrier-protein] synthase III C-terminal domain-containing protein [Nostoc sp. LEGE 12450]MBE8987829.1 3-oxoacyl-ACP synthase [Nostoc sp. LEGE 12450]